MRDEAAEVNPYRRPNLPDGFATATLPEIIRSE